MASVEKIIEKMRNQPNGIRFVDAEKVIQAYGYNLIRQNGSHRTYYVPETHLTLPEQNQLKSVYVKAILKIVEESEQQ